MKTKTLALYIHVPFCKSKCAYCSFVSFAGQNSSIKSYFNALKKEVELTSTKHKNFLVNTIFVGGGTPSYVESEHIVSLINFIKQKFNVSKSAEITLEANPESLTKQKLIDYKNAGINRLSIGLQTADAKLLKLLNRPHSVEDYKNAITLAKEVGFKNINTDLMLALPNQKLRSLKKALKFVNKMGVTHVSVYDLILEENTSLYNRVENGELKLSNEKLNLKMLRTVNSFLNKKGFARYEVSNYAKQGYECKHNLKYWNLSDYLGLGLASHSLVNGVRFSNAEDLNVYLENAKQPKWSYQTKEVLTIADKKQEFVMLGLRRTLGINLEEYKKLFKTNLIKEKQNAVEFLLLKGLIEFEDKNLRATKCGFEVLNSIIYKLVE